MAIESSGYTLPTKPKQPEDDPNVYSMLLYGVPKIGKTRFFSQWRDVFFLTTEPGSKGIRIIEEQPNNWKELRVVVKALEKDRRKFKTVIIDTADEAYRMCMEYVCNVRGIAHPSEEKSYGGAWDAVAQEFRGVITRLLRTGRGVNFTSHAKTETVDARSGQSFTRIIPTLTGQASRTITALVDIIVYAEYFKDLKTGETVRVLVCQGDETVQAGGRPLGEAEVELPRFLPLLKEGAYEDWLRAFRGKHPGINPTRLVPSAQTTEEGAGFLVKAKHDARVRKRKEEEEDEPSRKKQAVPSRKTPKRR